ncbi:molybdenum cofactor biosynthesis protein MoaE [Sphingobacterium alkalisoli]|uniref:Molybdopterin synthase catalytic subunit n=1 Tax=Sphingobacterium alkalisoli TaxID=1874115 RepID=A0A4U0H295_9SPHI|nr:molybdenum cofactor biosynthesis protein MoaE [Sphingobacterium alkalisoli]TJY65733.1 molybdenum cofactor biosynthesis protein MoaE [Sphingobacterium alkalisoli]GGH18688.1 hypothetical protein GCM10011418_22480 [Sphingobacterium alkalisoli]
MNKVKKIFQNSAISPRSIAESIARHASKTDIGAHQIFLGQIRSDVIENKKVKAIEYTAYEDLALNKMTEIREDIFAKYQLTCMHIYHSLGVVHAGEICLFVFTSSKHRNDATLACSEVVERIKNELPIWGREIFEDDTHQWKTNVF